MSTAVSPDVLRIDPEQTTNEIVDALRRIVGRELRRRGGVVGVSGGIDSSVTVSLCARAFGPERTLAVLMPEADSDDETLEISRLVADSLGVQTVVEDITETLRATRCYERRDEAVRRVIPRVRRGLEVQDRPAVVLGDRRLPPVHARGAVAGWRARSRSGFRRTST